uniref:Immunoglobulin superfamily member 2 n=1 Tax=Lygus hesperus TaxID=30085 RepID=A0A0A9X746_LYGHE
MSPHGAELLCDFPSSAIIVSNVIWERADLGALRDLDQLYKSVGESREYAVVGRPNGSTLKLHNVGPVDRGLYRCMATAADPSSNAVFTLFQDVPFYPEFGYLAKQHPHAHAHSLPLPPPRPPPCCRMKEVFRDFHHQHHQSSSVVVKSLSHFY